MAYGEGLNRHCLLPNPFMLIYHCIIKYVQIKDDKTNCMSTNDSKLVKYGGILPTNICTF